jgi:hypothetical protein
MLQGLSLGSLESAHVIINRKYNFMLYPTFSYVYNRKARMQRFLTKETSALRSVAFIEEIIAFKVQMNVFAVIYCAMHESRKLSQYSD